MVHNTQIRVYYEDTDMGGVVYYANYLKFLERGRSDAVREAGISQLEMRDAGLVFVVRRVEADYLRPARFEDLLRVQTSWRICAAHGSPCRRLSGAGMKNCSMRGSTAR